mgnify:CR=1 FL=1
MADAPFNGTIIGKDTTIKGEFQFDGPARILGTLEGTIASKGTLEVGEGGKCRATIIADRLVIDGRVDGDVTARTALQLNSKGNLHGDLVAASLTIAEGATLVGHCRVGPEAMKEAGSGGGGAPAASEPKAVRPIAEPAGRR